MKTMNNYAKKIAENNTGKIYENTHTTGYYLKEILEHGGGGGGGGSYDDTEIKRRISAVENGKQDKLTAGQNITISGNTIAAREIIDDTIHSSTTVWSSNKVKNLIEALEGQVDIVITPTKPAKSSAVEKTMYYVGTSSPYHIWFFVNDEYTDFGTTELDLSDYFTKAEINELLELKVDKVSGKSLVSDTDIAQINTNRLDIFDVKDEIYGIKDGVNINHFRAVETALDDKQDKITDSALSSIGDSTTVSSVDATAKTNKTFTLSKLWEYIKSKISDSTSDTYDSLTDDDLFSQKGAYNLWTNATKASNNITEYASSSLTMNLNTGFSIMSKSVFRLANRIYYVYFEIKTTNQLTADTEIQIINSSDNFKLSNTKIKNAVFSACVSNNTAPVGCAWNENLMYIHPYTSVPANSTIKMSGLILLNG